MHFARCLSIVVTVIACTFGVPPVSAQISGATYAVEVGGRSFTCESGGFPVVFVIKPNLGDAGVTQFAGSGAIIYLDPGYINALPTAALAFFVGHECGHAYLRTTSENAADCFSAMMGIRQGWFSESDLPAMQQIFKNNPGNSTHPPGPARFANITRCAKSAESAGAPSSEDSSFRTPPPYHITPTLLQTMASFVTSARHNFMDLKPDPEGHTLGDYSGVDSCEIIRNTSGSGYQIECSSSSSTLDLATAAASALEVPATISHTDSPPHGRSEQYVVSATDGTGPTITTYRQPVGGGNSAYVIIRAH